MQSSPGLSGRTPSRFLSLALACLLLSLATIPTLPKASSGEEEQKLEELFAVASLWQVGENRERVAKAREELIALGREAAEFILREKMATDRTLEIRAIDAVLWGLRDQPWLSGLLIERYRQETRPLARWMIMRQFGRLEIGEALPLVIEAIREGDPDSRDPSHRRLVGAALDDLPRLANPSEVDLTMVDRYLTGASSGLAISAAGVFQKLGGTRELELLMELYGSAEFARRAAFGKAIESLASKLPDMVVHRFSELAARERLAEGEPDALLMAELAYVVAREGKIGKEEIGRLLKRALPQRVKFALLRGAVEAGTLTDPDELEGLSGGLKSYLVSLLSAPKAKEDQP